MIRLNKFPTEGHLKASKRILAYLKKFPRGGLLLIQHIHTILLFPIEDHLNWNEFYLDTGEEIPTPNDLPKSKRPKAWTTVYVDT
jgi:hypothetical protein